MLLFYSKKNLILKLQFQRKNSRIEIFDPFEKQQSIQHHI